MITEINGRAVITFDCDSVSDVLELREELILLMWQITAIDNTPNALESLAKIIYIMGNDVK